MNRIFVFAFIMIAAVSVAVSFYGFPVTGESVNAGGTFEIQLSDITETAKFYEHDSIRFFAVRASDESIKTGFDACDICYGESKGYSQDGDYMVCNNCGNRYPISGLGTENTNPGGCWPGYLPNTVVAENVVIKESDINAGSWRFE